MKRTAFVDINTQIVTGPSSKKQKIENLEPKVFLEKIYTNTTEVNYYDNNLKVRISYNDLYNLERTYINVKKIKL